MIKHLHSRRRMLHLYVPVTVLVTLNVTVVTTRRVKSAALHCKHRLDFRPFEGVLPTTAGSLVRSACP